MILVVDDHADTRQALVRLLELRGHEAIAVADGAQLHLFLQTHPPPALIILDISMPHLDGMAALRALRADARLSAIPVVIFSSDDRPIPEAMRLGAAAYVVKGAVAWEKLSEQIDALAPGGNASTAGAGAPPAVEHARPGPPGALRINLRS